MSKHVLNTRLLRRISVREILTDAKASLAGEASGLVPERSAGPSPVMLSGPGAAAANQEIALGEGDPMPPDDRIAMGEVRNQLHQLYRKHSPRLVRQLARRTGCNDTAREVAQEAFLRLARLAPVRFFGIASPEAYLKTVSTNLLRDLGRAQAREQSFRRDRERADTHVDPLMALESRDTLRRLEAAMSRLKPKTREIFLAHRLDGLTYAEIAEQAGLSIKGVEKQMSKAIAKIARLLDRP